MSNPTAAPGIRGTAAEIVERAITGLRQAQTIEGAKAAISAITGQLTLLVDSLDEIVPPTLHEPLRIGVHIGQYSPDYATNGGAEQPR